MSRTIRSCTAIATSLVMVTLASCKPREDAGSRGSPPPGDPGAAAAMRDDTGQIGPPGLTDGNIVALLDEANQADSAAGAYALGKATNAEVKAFARLMMGEHHALRLQGEQLVRKLNVTPHAPADDPVKAAAESEMAALRAAPKGPQFDRVYIDQEVAIHKAVLDLAEKAHGAAQNRELKALIEKAKPVLEKHRDRAEELQKQLGKPTT